MTEETPTANPVFARICECSARLMSGSVSRPVMKELQKTVASTAGGYPWEAVVDRVLREPVDPDSFSTRALRAQRDWIVRGGRETPGKGVRHHAKSLVARLVARLIFLSIFVPAVVVLLVLVKHKWPEIDIYVLLDWLGRLWPSVFGPR